MLGALQAWTARFEMNPDGIQYLDNAAAYWRRDFHNALNTQWSPLYPWLIAALTAIVQPAREQEFPLVHLLNVFLFLASLAGFLLFMRSMRRLVPPASVTSLLLLSYSAFLYCSLAFTGLGLATPDLLVSLFAFTAVALLVRIASGEARAVHFALLGAVLGLGYLAKAPLLSIAVLCLLMTALINHRRVILACIAFVAITAPYVAALSQAKGRFTLGDSAALNVAWHVNGLPNRNWQGGPTANGRPVHPTRQLSAHPAIFEFATPVAGTYLPWYDPAYWNEGVRIAYRPRDFARATWQQIQLYGYWLHHGQTPLLFALLALFLICDRRRALTRLKTRWPILALGAVPFFLYAPVHAESRYLAPFFVLLWIALYSSVLDERRVSLAIAATAALFMLIETVNATFAPPNPDQPPARTSYEIAHELEALGLRPGDQVAMVDSPRLPYFWAYLTGSRVTLEIAFSDSYNARQAEWAAACRILASQPAVFVVSAALDGVTNQPGWRRLGTTGVFAYPLRNLSTY